MQEIVGAQPASVFSSVIDQMNTQTVPEFGPAAAIVLVMAISTLVIISVKAGLRIVPRY
ncbi:hypothetical protein DYY67_1262 [Candidatus Nitrosotalea sp. TS]|uniref:hypothetical protein n=1 Tax=Candidatus Nitrosotalea sp. TS TaxID=2341020 RepID=UPI001ED04EA2|nr:hypothetical protein [Candidatus Nitrosotalea sp. TS]NHI03467.1 hypothetical protein [Candidatus Nitrosotalea sp. TS]